MSTHHKEGFFKNLKYDLPASLVVFLVAMPLCLGIAQVSGAPLFSGIVAGIIGGIVVALLSGSPLGVSGPAAGLAIIVFNAIQDLGAFETFLLAVLLAGIMQLIFGFLKAGVIAYYFPSSVIKGMLAGIGVLIVLKEIPHAFGYDGDPLGDFSFFQSDGENTFSELVNMLSNITPGALVVCLISLVILALWERPFFKGNAFFKVVQGPLIVVALGIALAQIFVGTPLEIGGGHFVNLPVPDGIKGFFGEFKFPDFSQLSNPSVYTVAITIAVVASLETLLCVEATDKLDPLKRVTPTNRELRAQGIGNMISGLIGGLPITQVIVRSSANIQSGGRSKASAFFHGVLLLVCAMAIPFVLNMIPLASLAAILLVVGFKLAKPSLMRSMFRKGWTQFVPFFVTILGIVFTNMLLGIFLGLAVAIIQILYNNYRIPYYFDSESYSHEKPVHIHLAEEVSFLNKAGILRNLNHLPDGVDVIIDASKTRSIHPDVIEILEDFQQSAPARDIKVELIGLAETEAYDPVVQFGKVVMDKRNSRTKRA